MELPSCGVRLFLYRYLIENKRLAPFLLGTSLPNLPLITSLSLTPKKNRPQWITSIQHSRLHHWLPLSQVPKYRTRVLSLYLRRALLVGRDVTDGNRKVLLPEAYCYLRHTKLVF